MQFTNSLSSFASTMAFATLLFAVAVVSAVADCHGVPRADWATLNQTVGGRLHSATPLALPCFSIYNNATVTPNPALCSEVMSNYFNPDYRVSKYAAAMQVKFFRHLFTPVYTQYISFRFNGRLVKLLETGVC
jgi:hypothetical protein